MSDRPIQKGDLVQVVRTCCQRKYLDVGGNTGIVRSMDRPIKMYCKYCGPLASESRARAFHFPHESAPISWLKRLDPSALSEDVPADDEVTV